MKLKDYIEIMVNKDIDEEIMSLASLGEMSESEAKDKLITFYKEIDNPPKNVTLRFNLNNTEYGLIPNMHKITTSEFLDIRKYSKDIADAHKLMAVFYRPVTNKLFKLYRIEEYDPNNEYYMDMLDIDKDIYL